MDKKRKFDDLFEDGIFTVPKEYNVKVRSLYEYCKRNNLTVNELSKEQIERFVEKCKSSE